MANKKPKPKPKKAKTAKPKFAFRAGARVKGVKAQTAGEELARIREKHGELTPRNTVDESRPKSAPLHKAFQWNDAKAADEYRLQQARGLIRAVCVVYPDEPEPQPVYVHCRTPDDPEQPGVYEPVSVVVREPDLFAVALEELKEKLAGAARAVEELQNAAERAGKKSAALKVATVGRHLQAANKAAERVA